MQVPALFLVAAIFLLAGAWSSDSGCQPDAKQLANEANVAYRNEVTMPVKQIVWVEKANPKCLVADRKEQIAISSLMKQEEFFIPELNVEDQMQESIGQNNCSWMDRVNQMEEEAVVTNQNAEEPTAVVINWKSNITKNAERIGDSLLHLSNKMVTAIVEMHQHHAETRHSASPKARISVSPQNSLKH